MAPTGKTAIIVANLASVARAEAALLPGMDQPGGSLMGLVQECPSRSWSGKIEWRRGDVYLPDEETATIDDVAWTWARQWYSWLDEVVLEEMLSFQGVALGPFLEREALGFFVGLLKAWSVAHHFIEREQVGRLILFGGVTSSALAACLHQLGEERGLLVEQVPGPSPQAASFRSRLAGARAKVAEECQTSAERFLVTLTGSLPLARQRPPGRVRVLFQNHPLLKPVWQALVTLDEGQPCILRHHLLGFFQGRPPRGSRFVFLPRYARQEHREVATWAARWKATWPQVEAAADFWQRFQFGGWPVQDLVRPWLKALVLERLPELAALVASASEALRHEQIDLVALANDQDLPGKLLVAVARSLDIPSLVLDHGLTADIQQPQGFLDLFADKMANWGDGNRELLLRHGLAPDRLAVTGAPKFDASLQAARGSRATLCQELGIDPQQRLVVYAAHPDVLWYTSRDWHQWEMVSLLGQALAQIPNCQLVLRPHPSDKTLCQEHLPGDLQSEAVIARDANLYDLLIHCDLLITETSTVGLEAMLFDKPVMILNLRGRPDLVPYVKKGAALGVYDLPDLAQAMTSALDDEAVRERLGVARKAFTPYYLYRLDGRSSERVVGLILQMAAARNKE